MSKVIRIAVLVDTSTGWGRRVIRGIADYATKQTGWQLTVVESGRDEKLGLGRGWQGDGVIARIGDLEMYRELKAFGKPVINVSAIELKGVDFHRITGDVRTAAEAAVKHFAQRGYEHLAYCGLEDLQYVARHCEAFEAAAQARGFSCEVYHPSQSQRQSGWQEKREDLLAWLKELPKPIGIWTWASARGRNVLNACLDGGIDVPEQVAVLAGDDDELLCQVCTPPLSGMVTPAEQVGHEAARLLHAVIKGEELPDEDLRIAEAEINTRESTETLAISDPDVRKAMHYIREHLQSQILQVSELAEALGLSRRALERRFVKSLGHGPAHEIQKSRLKLVAKLLRETDMSISDIAARVGYSSSEYLIRVFKKDRGYTPNQFRVQNTEGA